MNESTLSKTPYLNTVKLYKAVHYILLRKGKLCNVEFYVN